ncbi:MAG: ABC transporter permease [Oscillospiraceae bacterium]|nr:ABC transporter permease [Oscillospiraceae bacterium]
MNKKSPLLQRDGVLTIISSVLCVILGLIVGFLAVLIIKPAGALNAIRAIILNFFEFKRANLRLENFGSTLAKTAPLIMCSLSVLFAYKVGLFNIGVAGQYALGAGMSIYAAAILHLPWYVCLLLGIIVGGVSGALCGVLKAYCNVNVVISGIMLNWISLYGVNVLLLPAKDAAGKDTVRLLQQAKDSVLPTLGLDKLFADNKYVGLAIPLAILMAILIWVLLEKTKMGYELKATGNNPNAAKYCGMKENRNIILTMFLAGGLASMGGALFYLTDLEQWNVYASAVPAMGFNGIAAAFLGGLSPIGCIFSSYFITHITAGALHLNTTMYFAQVADFITAVIIYLCGFVLFFKTLIRNRMRKQEERFTPKERDEVKAAEVKQEGGKQA